MHHRKAEAARVGSRGGERINQPSHCTTADIAAQPRCTSLPDRRATTKQRAVQLRIFALDGAWAEPYVARAKGNKATTSAAAGEVRRAKQWV